MAGVRGKSLVSQLAVANRFVTDTNLLGNALGKRQVAIGQGLGHGGDGEGALTTRLEGQGRHDCRIDASGKGDQNRPVVVQIGHDPLSNFSRRHGMNATTGWSRDQSFGSRSPIFSLRRFDAVRRSTMGTKKSTEKTIQE